MLWNNEDNNLVTLSMNQSKGQNALSSLVEQGLVDLPVPINDACNVRHRLKQIKHLRLKLTQFISKV